MGSAWEDRHKYSRAQRRDDDVLIEAWHSPRRSREIAMEFGIKLPQLMALWGELKQEGRLPDIPRDRRSRPPGGGRSTASGTRMRDRCPARRRLRFGFQLTWAHGACRVWLVRVSRLEWTLRRAAELYRCLRAGLPPPLPVIRRRLPDAWAARTPPGTLRRGPVHSDRFRRTG